MIVLDLSILNQKGTPMFNSDIFANRPAFGIVGRIFISTDTKEFFRDTGTSWELIGGPGSGTITGSGTTGTLSKFTSSSSIGDSIITEGTSLINITGSNSRLVIGGTDDGLSQIQSYFDGNTRLRFVAASNVATDDSDITGFRSRGTNAVRLAINNGDSITNFSGRGYNGTTFAGGAGFDVFAAENFSVGINGSYIAIETTPIGTATPTYFHRFSADGGFHVGQNSDPSTGYKFQTTGDGLISGRLDVNNSTADNQLRISGASSPSIRLDNALTAATQRFAIGLSTATNNFIQGSTAGNICITTASANPLLFGMWQSVNATEVMRISTANNLLVGTTTDSGFKLAVSGTASLGALTGTSATFSNNVGIGLAPIITSGGAFSQIFIGGSGQGGVLFAQNNAGSIALVSNAYYNASNLLIYINSVNGVGRIYNYNGEFIFSNAPVGTSGNTVTLTTRLTIASTGDATFVNSVNIGNSVAAAVAAPSTHKVAILIGGVQYYLLASNV